MLAVSCVLNILRKKIFNDDHENRIGFDGIHVVLPCSFRVGNDFRDIHELLCKKRGRKVIFLNRGGFFGEL